MQKISIVVPVYCNAETLFSLHNRLIEVGKNLKSLNILTEIIYVDDGSTDNSYFKLLEIKKNDNQVIVVKLTRNFGSVNAIKAGTTLITGDVFTFLSADLQDPPELIFKMVEKWKKGSIFTICVRASRADPVFTKLLSYFYYKIIRIAIFKDFPRGGFDMALMDKVILPYLQKSSKNLYLIPLIYWLGYKPEIIYYHREKRKFGKSKWSIPKKITAFLDVILSFSILPIRIMSLLGIVVSLLSFGYGILVVITAIHDGNTSPGYASIVAIVTFLLGLIILCLGLIGEYLLRILDQGNPRPEYVIEQILKLDK